MKAALRFVAIVLLAAGLQGQQPAQQSPPRVGYVYPAGGQKGTTVQVVVAGQFLDGAAAATVSGAGVRAAVVSLDKPLNQRQINDLREQAQALQAKAADPAVRQQLQTIRLQLGDSLKRQRNPVLADRATIAVTIEASAEPGLRQIRLRTPLGLSNPLVFAVGDLPEVRERDVKTSRADAELPVTLPVTVNGRLIPGDVDNVRQPLRQPNQYAPGDVDRYRFSATKGQQLVAAVSARDLIPYLADAVPGWCQTVVTLYDAGGREVAYADDFQFRPDPVLHYEVPADGEYVLEIRDAIYRGREDFVYRVSVGELPFVTSLFPLGGPLGARTMVEFTGWNLAATKATVEAPRAAGTIWVAAPGTPVTSNRRPFAAGALPERSEREPNDAPREAESVALPVVVNGRVARRGDRDVFSFKGRAGAAIVAEVTARRLESPLDASLELTDASGRRLAFNDDREDRSSGLATHHADSYVLASLPADGTYFIRLGDIQGKGGPEYAYRLRISAPQPDFELRLSPSSINAPPGTNVPITVTAVRRDGFAGDIALSIQGADGFALAGGLIPSGQDDIRVTVVAPPLAQSAPFHPRLEGRASIDGRTVVREAVPADDRMQAFAYHHLVEADELYAVVSGRGGTRVPARVIGAPPFRIPSGGSIRLRASLPPAYGQFRNIEFELNAPPEGIALRDASVRGTTADFVLEADAAKAKAGLRSNLIVVISGERVPPANAQGQAAPRRVPIGVLPAIPFEVVGGR